MSSAERNKKILRVALFCALYVALRVPWLLCVPHNEAPDEGNHLWVTSYLSTHFQPPTAAAVQAAGPPAEYGALPPLGYLPSALLAAPFSGDTFRLVARIGTLLAGLPLVVAACMLADILFASEFLMLMMPLLIVTHPQLIFTQAYTNTDATASSLTSLCILLISLSIKSGPLVATSCWVGFLFSWAALSKTNTLSLLPALMLGLYFSFKVHKVPIKEQVTNSVALLGFSSLATGCWYIRNFIEFHGDVLGSKTMRAMWESTLPHENGKTVLPWPKLTSLAWWRFLFFDFWGLFGYMNRYLWRPLYIAYFGMFITAVVGWIKPSKPIAAFKDDLNSARSIWFFLTACALLNFAATVYVTISGLSGPHGRYLFPTELPIFALLLAGFYRINATAGKWLTIALLLLNIICTGYGFFAFYAGKSWQ